MLLKGLTDGRSPISDGENKFEPRPMQFVGISSQTDDQVTI